MARCHGGLGCAATGLALGCALLVSGCAAFAGKQDYADYRRVRLAQGQDARLLAMAHYVRAHPDGRWVEPVQRARAQHDAELFQRARGDREGLELYLAAYPDGLFVEQARSRLSAIAMIEQRKRQERARAQQLAQERKAREAELARTWVSRFTGYWLRTLVGLSHWGEPIEQVARNNPGFSRAFGRPPRPRCTRDECVKYYDDHYAVPVPGGTRIERRMRVLLRLSMREGRVEQAQLLLPGWGFSRWAEVEQRRAVVDSDPQERMRAVQWALAQLTPVLAELGQPREVAATMPSVAAPALGASGELTDTTATDPGAPSNRIQGSAGQTAAEKPEPIERLVAPEAQPEPADMVMETLTVDKRGRAVAADPAAGQQGEAMEMSPLVVAPEGGSATTMEMSPLVVGEEGQGPAHTAAGNDEQAAAAAAGSGLQPGSYAPPVVRAFELSGVRVVFFAAGTDAAAPAYDGVLIERAPQPK